MHVTQIIYLMLKIIYLVCLVLQEVVAGVVIVQSKGDVQHQGISLEMEGTVSLQLSAKSVGLFEAFYNSLKVGPRPAKCLC